MAFYLQIAVFLGLVAFFLCTRRTHRGARPGTTPKAPAGKGYLYFIGGTTGPVKVGITRGSPWDRCADLQTGNPTSLTVLAAHLVDDPEDAEGRAHNLLADHHIGGEWYSRGPALEFERQLANPTPITK